MARFSDKDRRLAIGVIMVILVMMPVFFIYTQAVEIINNDFVHTLADIELRLKAEMRQFKSDLVPKTRINKLIKQAERDAELVWDSEQTPVFRGDTDPQVYNSQTMARLMDSFEKQAGVKPLALVVSEYNVREIYSWFDRTKIPLEEHDLWLLGSCMALNLARPIDQLSVYTNPDSVRIGRWLARVEAGYSGTNEARIRILQKYFSHMAFRPPAFLDTHEMVTLNFGAQRLFMYARPIIADEVFLGGFFVVFSDLEFPPEKLIAHALSSPLKGFERLMHDEPSAAESNDNIMKIDDLTPAEFVGYGMLHDTKVPGCISVSYDYSQQAREHKRTVKMLRDFCLAIFAVSVIIALAFWCYAFPEKLQLRGQMAATIAMVMLMPYVLMGSLSAFLFHRIDNLRRYEIVAHGQRHLHELESFHHDQKLQHLLQLMRFKLHLSRFIDKEAAALTYLPAHEIVPSDGYVQLLMTRFDGLSRSFRSQNFMRTNVSSIESIIGVRYLDALGVLDRGSAQAQSFLKVAGYSDALLQQLVENNFEYYNMLHESTEVRQMRKIDDYSRMTFHLITSNSDKESIRGIVFNNLADHSSLIYSPKTYKHSIFAIDYGLVDHAYAIGRMMSDNSVRHWWPIALNQDSSRVQLVFDAAKTRSTGFFATKGQHGEQLLNNWKFLKGDLMVIGGITTSRPDPVIELAGRAMPLFLFSLSLIMIFLFSDVLVALFIKPVSGFIEAFNHVGSGRYDTRINIAATDEFFDLADSFNSMTLSLDQREKMRRFVSDRLFDSLSQEGGLAKLSKPQQAKVSILASDIRGFTSISEKRDPEEIVSLLNDYFTLMEAAVIENGGFIEKFVGDAVTAVFYHDDNNNSALKAIKAAFAMREKLAELNNSRSKQNLFTIENGIGIASGSAISGIAGSESGRMVFAVIGGVTAHAEQLEAATPATTSKILVCQVTAENTRTLIGFNSYELTPDQLAFEPVEVADD